ncbi:MAG: TolB family protein [Planctomycetota bacterium]|jgi:hypothetical protein
MGNADRHKAGGLLLAAVLLHASAIGAIEEERISTIGPVTGIVDDSMVVSPDGARLAFVEKMARSNTRRLMVDGRHVGGVYDEIAKGTPIFSQNSKRVAFAARRGNECFVVVDGHTSRPYAMEGGQGGGWPVGSMVFSPDCAHVAYQVRQKDGAYVVVDRTPHGPYDDVTLPDGRKTWGIWEFMFSPDSRHFAFRARKGRKMVACVGGFARDRYWNKPLISAGPFDSVGRSTPVWTTGSSRRRRRSPGGFAFIVREGGSERVLTLPRFGRGPPAHEVVVRDTVVSLGGRNLAYVVRKDNRCMVARTAGPSGKPYDDIGVLMTRKGRLAYAAAVGKEVCVVVDGKEGPRYDGVRYPGTVFGPQGKRVAYAVARHGKAAVWIDEREGKWYRGVDHESLCFSPDGKRFAFTANLNGKDQVAVLAGKEGPAFTEVSSLSFSRDGTRFAYAARRGLKHWLVVDGQEFGPYDEVRGRTFRFSPDGKRHACVVYTKGACHVLSDGVPGPPCDRVMSRLTFSAGGDCLAYVVRTLEKGRRHFSVVYNRIRGRSFDTVWIPGGGNLRMDDVNVVRFFAVNNGLVQSWSAGPGGRRGADHHLLREVR